MELIPIVIYSTRGTPIVRGSLTWEQWASYQRGCVIEAASPGSGFQVSLPICLDTTKEAPPQGEVRHIHLLKEWHKVYNNLTIHVAKRGIPVKQFKKRLMARKGAR